MNRTSARFLQPDTIVPDPANPQSLNRYSYVLNNPLRYTDPTGRQPLSNTDIAFCLLGIGCPGSGPNPVAIRLPVDFHSQPPYGGVNFPGPDWLYEGARVGCDITLICGAGCGAFEAGGGPECFTQDRLGTGSRALSGTGVIPVGRLGKFLKAARFLKFADEVGDASRLLPSALQGGPANVHVYFGVKNGERVYVGISSDVASREARHNMFGFRFRVQPITTAPVTRGQARAIEEALIVENMGKPGWQNVRHSIDPNHSYYQEALDWGGAWLRGHGY